MKKDYEQPAECRGTIIFTFSNRGDDMTICNAKEKDILSAIFRLSEVLNNCKTKENKHESED